MFDVIKLLTSIFGAFLLFLGLEGCAQEQGTVQQTPSSVGPVDTTQQQAQDGPRIANTINIVTDPDGKGKWDNKGWEGNELWEMDEVVEGPPSTQPVDTQLALRGKGHYYGINIGQGAITFGSQTITADNAGTQGQTPSIAQTVTPTQTGGAMNQEPSAVLTLQIPIAWAGGSAQGGPMAGAGKGGTTGEQTSTQSATIDWLQQNLKTTQDKLNEALKFLQETAGQGTTTQPGDPGVSLPPVPDPIPVVPAPVP